MLDVDDVCSNGGVVVVVGERFEEDVSVIECAAGWGRTLETGTRDL